jgi:D-alanyl-D-alanine carboxypeptidase/D-alanyl-D-alanine-endopeptidase (penicillin-binding protein 4)
MRKLFAAQFIALLAACNLLAQWPNTNTSLADLQARLSEIVTHPRYDAAMWGVKVVSLETKKTVFEHNSAKLFSPASNCKLYTMALALDQLGGDHRIRTSLYSEARPDKRGVLKGDLIVYGRGDPTFNTRLNGGDIFRALQPLVANLTNAGVRRITGDLIGDESFIVGSPFGSGWAWDDMNYYYGAEISALTINDNILRATVQPGANIGDPCKLYVAPATSYITFSNRTETIAANGNRDITFYRPVSGNVIYVSGRMPLGATNHSDDITVRDPAKLFVMFFREALLRNGIKVGGATRSENWLDRQIAPRNSNDLIELGFVESIPMREINREVQKPSQNLYTDLMLAYVGNVAAPREKTAGHTNDVETVIGATSSEDLGVAALDKFMRKIGVKRGDVKFEEGSGLSRNNLVTPDATIALLEYMSRHAEAESYLKGLPIAGVDGSLRNRMKRTRAEGNVHAKTGTLRWANALSGYVMTAGGERLAFCFMLNRYSAPSDTVSARNELDKLTVMLADFAGRSDARP